MQKGQNLLSLSHLIKIGRLNLNICCDPAVSGNITGIASCWDNIHYTLWCHAVSSHITGMGITRDTVWCVICDRESIVTRSHKQICYIHWSRTIDLGLPHLGPACSPFRCKYYFVVHDGMSLMVTGLRLSQHNLIKLLPATPSGISLYRDSRGIVTQRPSELDAKVFLYLSQYFSASEITRWMFWDIFWPLHHRVQFSVGTECKYYSSS